MYEDVKYKNTLGNGRFLGTNTPGNPRIYETSAVQSETSRLRLKARDPFTVSSN